MLDQSNRFQITGRTGLKREIHTICKSIYLSVYLAVPTYQVVKDVSLMHMNGDQRLEFSPLHLGQLLGGDVDQGVEQVEELLVGGRHDFLVGARVFQGLLGVPGPDHLYAQQTHLQAMGSRVASTPNKGQDSQEV